LSRSISGKAKDPLMFNEKDPPKESGQAFQRLGDVALVSVNGSEEQANACPAELRESPKSQRSFLRQHDGPFTPSSPTFSKKSYGSINTR
jgi:hypothetical protein